MLSAAVYCLCVSVWCACVREYMSPKEISQSIVRQLGRPIVGHLLRGAGSAEYYNRRLMNPKCACASLRRLGGVFVGRARLKKSVIDTHTHCTHRYVSVGIMVLVLWSSVLTCFPVSRYSYLYTLVNDHQNAGPRKFHSFGVLCYT